MNTDIKLLEHQKPDRKKLQKWRTEMRDQPVKHKRKTDGDLLDVTVWEQQNQTVSVCSLC